MVRAVFCKIFSCCNLKLKTYCQTLLILRNINIGWKNFETLCNAFSYNLIILIVIVSILFVIVKYCFNCHTKSRFSSLQNIQSYMCHCNSKYVYKLISFYIYAPIVSQYFIEKQEI